MELKIIDELIGGMPSWTEEANCKGADADLFFPERGASTRKANTATKTSWVKKQCLSLCHSHLAVFAIKKFVN